MNFEVYSLSDYNVEEIIMILFGEGNEEMNFENYVFHMTRNESYTCWDDYEIRNGEYFIIFDKSRLLDYLPQIVIQGIVEAYYPKGWKHYGIYCQNHIIDVIATKEPRIKKYTR